jgi:hypothetical protein
MTENLHYRRRDPPDHPGLQAFSDLITMSPSDQLLLSVLEDMRPDQLDAMLAISARKGQPLASLIVEAIRAYLDQLSAAERAEAIRLLGTDWDQL